MLGKVLRAKTDQNPPKNPLKTRSGMDCASDRFCVSVFRGSGGVLGAFARLWGPTWSRLGASGGVLEPSWHGLAAVLGRPWGVLGCLGASWGRLGGVLGASRGRLGPSWRRLGGNLEHLGGVLGRLRRPGCRLGDVQKRVLAGITILWARTADW